MDCDVWFRVKLLEDIEYSIGRIEVPSDDPIELFKSFNETTTLQIYDNRIKIKPVIDDIEKLNGYFSIHLSFPFENHEILIYCKLKRVNKLPNTIGRLDVTVNIVEIQLIKYI